MEKVNLFIVTHNRSKYLKRILDYYNSCRIEYKIIVSDSSSKENKIKNKEIVFSFPNLNILYLDHYSDRKSVG